MWEFLLKKDGTQTFRREPEDPLYETLGRTVHTQESESHRKVTVRPGRAPDKSPVPGPRRSEEDSVIKQK